MVKRYNPPPGWLVPGEGWRPSFDWRPDPAWPPAPVDWDFWVDHEQGPAPAVAASPRGWRFRRGYLGVAVVLGLIGVGVLTGVLGSSAGQHGSVTFVAASAASATETAQPSGTPSQIPTTAPITSPVPRATAAVIPIAAAARPTGRTHLRQTYTRPLASRPLASHSAVRRTPRASPTTASPTPTRTTPPSSSPAPTVPISCDPGPPRLGRLGELLPDVCSGLAGRLRIGIPPR